jgi:hypothetical protein
MNQNYPFFVSEWEWFKLQLRLCSLETKGELWLTTFAFDEETNSETINHKIICKIYNGAIDEILKEVNSKEQLQEEYFIGWTELVKQRIETILKGLPRLKENLDLESDIKFEVMKSNVISSYLICSIIGDAVSWNPSFKL